MLKIKLPPVIFGIIALLCLTPWITSPVALVLGMAIAWLFENPRKDVAQKFTPRFLSTSIIGLGAGMNLNIIAKAGVEGFAYTFTSIILTLALGTAIGRLFKIEKNVSLLVSSGTAICGGSAIAAVASSIEAKSHEISVALATVFSLNALALIIFPIIGHHFNLNETQFGLWSALAIHDTSSVVGATMQYGRQALEIGTTIKLARALWIIPLVLAVGFFRTRAPGTKIKRPWFILGFLLSAALVTWIPELKTAGGYVAEFAKHLFVMTLFLVGSQFSPAAIKSVGARPLLQGITLWICVASATLVFVLSH